MTGSCPSCHISRMARRGRRPHPRPLRRAPEGRATGRALPARASMGRTTGHALPALRPGGTRTQGYASPLPAVGRGSGVPAVVPGAPPRRDAGYLFYSRPRGARTRGTHPGALCRRRAPEGRATEIRLPAARCRARLRRTCGRAGCTDRSGTRGTYSIRAPEGRAPGARTQVRCAAAAPRRDALQLCVETRTCRICPPLGCASPHPRLTPHASHLSPEDAW